MTARPTGSRRGADHDLRRGGLVGDDPQGRRGSDDEEEAGKVVPSKRLPHRDRMAGLSVTIDRASVAPRRWKKPPLIKSAWLRWSLGLGARALSRARVRHHRGELDAACGKALPRGARFFAAFFPPNFTSRWAEIAEGMQESLWHDGGLHSRRHRAVDPDRHRRRARTSRRPRSIYFCRGILAVSRSFQEVILAIFFVKLFGFGPFAGLVTLSFATIGFYGKLLAEDIEDMDPAQAEAVRATGAGWLQWINYGVQPQVMPRMIGLGALSVRHQFPRIRPWSASSAAAASARRSTPRSTATSSIRRRRS